MCDAMATLLAVVFCGRIANITPESRRLFDKNAFEWGLNTIFN